MTVPSSSRRQFLKTTAAGASVAALSLPSVVHAAGGGTIRVGLVGCGGRGTGAAHQALMADKEVKLVAMADAFPDKIESSLATLEGNAEIKQKINVPKEKRFTGFNCYKDLLASGVDVILLASPPHFRPAQIEAAVAAGKHIFAEKPIAVDSPGVRRVQAASEQAKAKGLALVSGLCYRYQRAKRETIKRVHDGAVGNVVALQTSYNTGPLWTRERTAQMSDMEWQMRNWLYFTWLSGDFIVEQHIHSLDKMAWVMHDEPPISAVSLGGRQVRIEPQFGHIYDHFATVYEYKGGVKLFSYCRQMARCHNDVSDHVLGSKGTCDVQRHIIRGENKWTHRAKPGDADDMYQNEHDELFASIRDGKPLNNGDYMCKSTLMAIMGRMAAYTGQLITWDKALASTEDLTPAKYEFGPHPVPPVALPGVTQFS